MSDRKDRSTATTGKLGGLIADLIETSGPHDPEPEPAPEPVAAQPETQSPKPKPGPAPILRRTPLGSPPDLSSKRPRPKPEAATQLAPKPEAKRKEVYDPLARVRAASEAREAAMQRPAPTGSSAAKGRSSAPGRRKKKTDLFSGPPPGPERGAGPIAKSENEAPKLAVPREWDTVADHKMTSGGRALWMLGIYGAIAMVPAVIVLASPFPPKEAVLHHFSALGCNFAQMAGLSQAELGKPGYHASLDPDGNGVACEPDMTARVTSDGSRFLRP